MLFHAKALEVYTHTCHNLEAIDTQRDLEVASANDSILTEQKCVIIEDKAKQQTGTVSS